MKIAVLAQGPAFDGGISDAFSEFWLTKLYTLYPSDYRQHDNNWILLDNIEACSDARDFVASADIIFIAGAISATCLSAIAGDNWLKWTKKLRGKVAVYGTDTPYWNDPNYYNELVVELGATLFLMPDLLEIAKYPAIPLFRPQRIIDGKKNEKITIIHSPGRKLKMETKGTAAIEVVIDDLKSKFDFNYHCLIGLSHRECLKIKSTAHIMIDQLPPAGLPRGLGSSGLEGLAAGCLTLSDVNDADRTVDYFEYPPVVPIHSQENLKKQLERALSDESWRDEIRQNSQQWIRENLEYKPWLDYVQSYL